MSGQYRDGLRPACRGSYTTVTPCVPCSPLALGPTRSPVQSGACGSWSINRSWRQPEGCDKKVFWRQLVHDPQFPQPQALRQTVSYLKCGPRGCHRQVGMPPYVTVPFGGYRRMKAKVPQPSGRTSLPADHLPARGRRTSSHFLSQACGCSRVLWNLKPACSPPPSPGYHCSGVFVLRGFAHTCAWMTVLVVFQGTVPGFAAGVGGCLFEPPQLFWSAGNNQALHSRVDTELKTSVLPTLHPGWGRAGQGVPGEGTAGDSWAEAAALGWPHPVRIHRVADAASPAGGRLTCCGSHPGSLDPSLAQGQKLERGVRPNSGQWDMGDSPVGGRWTCLQASQGHTMACSPVTRLGCRSVGMWEQKLLRPAGDHKGQAGRQRPA